MIRLYFPATFFLQYVDAGSISEFKSRLESGKLAVLLDFLKLNPLEDVRTTVYLLPNYRSWYYNLRNILSGLTLTKHVSLFFKHEEPIELIWDSSEELVWELSELKLDPVELHRLRLRKRVVIDRILVTHLIFDLYYDVSTEIHELAKEYRKLAERVKNSPDRRAARYALIEKEFTPYGKPEARPVYVTVPNVLKGFVSAAFPLLSFSGAFQLAIQAFFAYRRYELFNDAIASLDIEPEFVKEKLYLRPERQFVDGCLEAFRRNFESYLKYLERFIRSARSVLVGKDEVEAFLESNLPATFSELARKCKVEGIDYYDVVRLVEEWHRTGRVRFEGEVIYLESVENE